MSATRVNPYPLPDLLSALEQLQKQQQTASQQLATGSTINSPSDNPTGAAELSQLANQGSQVDSFQQSVGSVNGQFSTAASTLNSVVTALQRAITLGVEGANGTLSASDRADVSAELSGIQSQLISLANTSYQGQFLFAGTANVQPFVVDNSSSSGVTYKGNQGVNQVTVGNGYQLQVNLPGSQVFNGAGADVFQSMQDLINAMNSNTGIPTAVNELSAAYSYINTQQVFYANGMNQATAQSTYLSTEKLDLSQQQNTVGAADMASVASAVVSDQTAATAAIEAIAHIPQTSLFDYLK